MNASNAQLFARLSDLLPVPENEVLLRLGGTWERPWLVARTSAGTEYLEIVLEWDDEC